MVRTTTLFGSNAGSLELLARSAVAECSEEEAGREDQQSCSLADQYLQLTKERKNNSKKKSRGGWNSEIDEVDQ